MDDAKPSADPLPMMDIIDPAFDGADGIDGDDLLQALSDHEDIMDFHDEHAAAGNDNDNNNDLPSYQQMMAAAQMNATNSNNNSGHMIGTTIKAPLAPLEPPTDKQPRGRQRRAPRRKPRSRSSSQDATLLEGMQPPLFGGGGGGGGGSRSVDHSFRDNTSFNDNASAASAPADLFDLGGGPDNFDPTAIPDVMDIQKMLIMRGLLDEGGLDEPPNFDAQHFQPASVRRNPQMRRRTVDGPDGDLASSQGSNASNRGGGGGGGGGGHRPYRRRKTLDDPLSIFMADNTDGGGIPTLEELQTAFPSHKSPIKRRKSEPLMTTLDFWDEGAGIGNDNVDDVGGTNNNMGVSQQEMMNSTFIAAAKEAFDSINRLKELMNGGMGGGGMPQPGMPPPVTSGGMRQPQQQQQPAFQRRESGEQYRRSFHSQGSSCGSMGSMGSVGSGPRSKSASRKGSKKSPAAAAKAPPPPQSVAPGMAAPQIPLPTQSDPTLLNLDPTKVMAKLQQSMERTKVTQQSLQEWDRAQGLPKSHSQTMVNSSRSRKQLTDGVILKKWNGAPLLNFGKEGAPEAAEAAASRMDSASRLGQN